jgi:spore germination cell wall hydrolase CwlJ-like protein
MHNPIRLALLATAGLAATNIAPAQAGPTSRTLAAEARISLPDMTAKALAEPQESLDAAKPLGEAEAEAASPLDTPAEPAVAAEPAIKPGADLTEMVAALRHSDAGSREMECLATGIYFESKSEPLTGQLAVGHVIANRANSNGRFPSTYCGVLFQRGQFSFIRGKSLPSVPKSSKQWKTAVAIAKIVAKDLKQSAVGKALFFHARYVSPKWRLKRVAAIGNHIFYR